jgi:hypothetical protein
VPLVLQRTHLSKDESSELRPMKAYGLSEDGVYGLRAEFERGEGNRTQDLEALDEQSV